VNIACFEVNCFHFWTHTRTLCNKRSSCWVFGSSIL